MARKTIAEQTEDIEQRGGAVPGGYTYDPRHEPRLHKTPEPSEDGEVANGQPSEAPQDTGDGETGE